MHNGDGAKLEQFFVGREFSVFARIVQRYVGVSAFVD